MGLIDRLFGRKEDGAALYAAVVARARLAHWYAEGAVPDTIDGRFDTIVAVLAMVLLRLEQREEAAALAVAVTERFVDDMEPQLREIGIGDIVVGKHMGRMMSMLGGRLGAYRDALATGSLDEALVRNLYRAMPPPAPALRHVGEQVMRFYCALDGLPLARFEAGELPA